MHTLRRLTRGAVLSAALVATLPAASAAQDLITSAKFTEPTTRYPHGVLGDDIEYGALELLTKSINGPSKTLTLRLPENRVFEDLTPRLIDLDGDGAAEVVVVESEASLGARLSVYNPTGLLTATPHIGQKNRWLAPVGAADFDGDGQIEIAYIDRPHLAKTLRLWRFKDGTLTEVASQTGLTNHQIGWNFIAGGIRTCQGTPEMITANSNWTRIIATQFDGQALSTKDIGAYTGPESLTAALSCS